MDYIKAHLEEETAHLSPANGSSESDEEDFFASFKKSAGQAEVADDPPAPVVVARRRVWVHSIIRGRGQYGEYHRLCQELRLDEDRFKWRLYRRVLGVSPEVAESAMKATCILHNYMRWDGEGEDGPRTPTVPSQGAVQSIPRVGSNNTSREAVADLRTPKTGSGTESGEVTVATWQYYDLMHKVLGARPAIDPPVLVSSIQDPMVILMEMVEPYTQAPTTAASTPVHPTTSIIRRRSKTVAELLAEEALQEQRRHEESEAKTDRFLDLFERMVNKL
ncbi:unnamed protein product [Gadus morhua 'NCC']